MRISLLTPPSPNAEPWYPAMESKGIKVDFNSVHPDCDFIVSTMPTGYMHLLEIFHNTFPDKPIIIYLWDLYKTIWTPPFRNDWKKHIEYLKKAEEIWCPSNEVIKRVAEEGVDPKKCKLIKTWARFFDYKEEEIVDKGYILQPMRPYPNDKNFGWLKQACNELEIPLIEPNHSLTEDAFRKVIAECTFMCTEYHEASTGGLTLLEGYKLGKPVVISDSEYMGAQDYFENKAIYFNDNDYEDFKRVIKETWNNTPKLNLKECEKFCNSHPSVSDMVDKMIERLEHIKNQ